MKDIKYAINSIIGAVKFDEFWDALNNFFRCFLYQFLRITPINVNEYAAKDLLNIFPFVIQLFVPQRHKTACILTLFPAVSLKLSNHK